MTQGQDSFYETNYGIEILEVTHISWVLDTMIQPSNLVLEYNQTKIIFLIASVL